MAVDHPGLFSVFVRQALLCYDMSIRAAKASAMEKKPMLGTWISAFISILLLVAGQSLLKYGLMRAGGVNFGGGEILRGLRTILTSPYIIVGFGAYGLSALLWLDVLSKLAISYAFPLVSMTYVVTLFVGKFFFGEVITWSRVVGVLTILVGVIFVARS
jgi:drug/metabolite transporter (DMT)-like permease